MSLAACGTEAEVCMSLPPDISDFGSGLAFTESALCMGGGGVLGSSVAKSPDPESICFLQWVFRVP